MRQIISVPVTWVKFALQMQLKLLFAKRNKKDKWTDAWHLTRQSDTFRWFNINLVLHHSVLAVIYIKYKRGKNDKWLICTGSLFSCYIIQYFHKRNNFCFQSYLFHKASHERCWPPHTGKSCGFSNPRFCSDGFVFGTLGKVGTHTSLWPSPWRKITIYSAAFIKPWKLAAVWI